MSNNGEGGRLKRYFLRGLKVLKVSISGLAIIFAAIVVVIAMTGDAYVRREFSPQRFFLSTLARITGRDTGAVVAGENPGVLHIGAPQVFTRERLVNDRFAQVSWLDKELKRTEDATSTELLAMPSSSLEVAQSRGIKVASPTTILPHPQALDDTLQKTNTNRLDPRLVFERKLELRERIRNSLMDAQLDDGHDLGGNTLYRLNFDAATVPFVGQRDFPGSAIFVISVKEAQLDEKGALEDRAELLKEWRREMQTYFSNIIRYRLTGWQQLKMLRNPFDAQESMAFDTYLKNEVEDRVSKYINRVLLSCADFCNIHIGFEGVSLEEVIKPALERIAILQRFWDVQDTVASTQGKACLSELINAIPYLRDHPTDKHYLIWLTSQDRWAPCGTAPAGDPSDYQRNMLFLLQVLDRLLTLSDDDFSRHAADQRYPVAIPSDDSLHSVIRQDLRDMVPARSCIRVLAEKAAVERFLDFLSEVRALSDVPRSISDGRLSEFQDTRLRRFDMAKSLAMQLSSVKSSFPPNCEGANQNDGQAISEDGEQCSAYKSINAVGRCHYARGPDRAAARKILIGFLQSRLNDRLDGFFTSDRDLRTHFDLEMQGCELGKCELRLQPKPGDPGTVDFEIFNAEAARALYDEINSGSRNRLMVYSVTPRTLFEVVDNSTSTETELGASAGTSGTGSFLGYFNRLEGRTEKLAEPFIIGFSDLAREEVSKFPKEASFGWIVRPRRTENGNWRAEHHSFSALLAIPSWWMRIEVKVKTCWARPYDVARLEPGALEADPRDICRVLDGKGVDAELVAEKETQMPCNDRVTGTSRTSSFERCYLVRLPGTVEMIKQRYELDVLKAPYFNQEWQEAEVPTIVLESGRSGKLALKGERLWRSTVVMLLDAAANTIQVMPDMRGVVASFECLPAPPGIPHVVKFDTPAEKVPRPVGVPVRVWTSEGQTPLITIHLAPFIARSPEDKPCYLQSERAVRTGHAQPNTSSFDIDVKKITSPY